MREFRTSGSVGAPVEQSLGPPDRVRQPCSSYTAYDKTRICTAIRALIGDQGFIFEDSQVVWSALKDYEGSKVIRGKALDFADALMARKSEYVAIARAAAFEGLFSFDKAVAQLSGAKPVDA